jgi:hypothetical protein
MSDSDDFAARLTVLETVVKQLLTHLAVRNDDPALWVQTRKTLARAAIEAEAPHQAGHLSEVTDTFFAQVETVTRDYEMTGKSGTTRVLMR